MEGVTSPGQITDNQEASRFEFVAEGSRAELHYRRRGNRLVITHTGVPAELEGRRIGSALVAAAVDRAIAEHLTVVPLCPFARGWLERHPDIAARVAVDWGTESAP